MHLSRNHGVDSMLHIILGMLSREQASNKATDQSQSCTKRSSSSRQYRFRTSRNSSCSTGDEAKCFFSRNTSDLSSNDTLLNCLFRPSSDDWKCSIHGFGDLRCGHTDTNRSENFWGSSQCGEFQSFGRRCENTSRREVCRRCEAGDRTFGPSHVVHRNIVILQNLLSLRSKAPAGLDQLISSLLSQFSLDTNIIQSKSHRIIRLNQTAG